MCSAVTCVTVEHARGSPSDPEPECSLLDTRWLRTAAGKYTKKHFSRWYCSDLAINYRSIVSCERSQTTYLQHGCRQEMGKNPGLD